MKKGFRPEARQARLLALPATPEERFECKVEPTQNLLFGRETASCKAFVSFSDSLEFERLIAVPRANAAAPVSLNTLLKGSVVQVAKGAKPYVRSMALRAARLHSKF